MSWFLFLLGLGIGVGLAPANGKQTWSMLRNRLALFIDAVLRSGVR